ncbi:MAG: DNA polymerase II [Planctomycetota bacterium]
MRFPSNDSGGASPPVQRGFILHPTYKIENGRAVVHLYGRLEGGERFLVRDDRQIPHFYIRTQDQVRAHAIPQDRCEPSDRHTFQGDPVTQVDVRIPSDTPGIRNKLQRDLIQTYEADVRFAMRYLIDRGIRGSIAIHGHGKAVAQRALLFENPTCTAGDWDPELTLLSFDIETDMTADKLLSFSLYGCGAAEVHLLDGPGLARPQRAVVYDDERSLLEAFCRRVRELDPDIITGWNIVEFDFPVLEKIGKRCGVPLELGRSAGVARVQAGSGRGGALVNIIGRVVLDGIRLLRGAFVQMDSYALDAVAREILGEGKLLAGHGRGQEISRLFEEDRDRFVEYNLTDARLVVEILEKMRLIELSVERSRLTGLPLDRVSGSIAAFDFLYLSELHQRKIVAPTVGAFDEEREGTTGGHVLEPKPGLHDRILVFDFKSLYPSVIRTFQIDPLGLVYDHGQEETDQMSVIVAPNGARFRREPGILTAILDELFPRRAAAQAAGNKVASQAIKILMNSFYGVLGTPACRFYNSALANAITSFGRELLLWSQNYFEQHGHRVLYGDTDSLFVESNCEDSAAANARGEALCAELNAALTKHIAEKWQVESRLELQFETLYLRLYLPAMRHSTAGARKRYAGMVQDEEQGLAVVFKGLEAVRRDWTDLARRVQREIYRRLFLEEPIPDYLCDIIDDLRAGQFDEELVYRKALRKKLEAYTSTTPPHVAAARKLDTPPGRLIEYYMTKEGPEPLAKHDSPIDYEHYLDKQLRPIAEPVLDLIGVSFQSLLGGEQQLELF